MQSISIPLPPLRLLNSLFYISRVTGVLVRRSTGKVAGWLGNNGYQSVSVGYRKYLVHRIMYYMHTGTDPGEKQVDHRNGVRADLADASHVASEARAKYFNEFAGV